MQEEDFTKENLRKELHKKKKKQKNMEGALGVHFKVLRFKDNLKIF